MMIRASFSYDLTKTLNENEIFSSVCKLVYSSKRYDHNLLHVNKMIKTTRFKRFLMTKQTCV